MKKVLPNIIGIVVIAAIAFVIYLFVWGQGILVSKKSAITALETQGFSNITITKRQWHWIKMRGGSEDDDVRFTATATNPAGKQVKVYVYAGWPWKAATVKTP